MGGTGCYKAPLWEGLVAIRYLYGRDWLLKGTFTGGTGCYKVPLWEGLVAIRHLYGRDWLL